MNQQKPRRFSLIAPSTRALYREGKKIPGYTFWDFVHGYIYAAFPYLYIGIGKGDLPAARVIAPLLSIWNRIFPKETSMNHSLETAANSVADGYHGKVTPLESAKKLIMVNEPIHVEDLEQVIPYVRARSIIQQNPDHIVVLECPCRAAKPNPCLPLDVCLIIGEPFASFISEHHPNRSRWIEREEALQILEEEDDRGHVHHVFFKDAMLGRFYAICNCCSCCCGAMNIHATTSPMLASSGYLSLVDPSLCQGCGDCIAYCQFHALSLVDGINSVDPEKCMGCGVCVSKCEQNAISLCRDESKGIPLEIENLMHEATSEIE